MKKKPFLKFCGNRTYMDYTLMVRSQADYIGFVFYGKSKRYVNPHDVQKWCNQIQKKNNQQLVGVFVNPGKHELAEVVKTVNLDIIQLHGTESPAFVKEVKETFSCMIWKTIHDKSDALQSMQSYRGLIDGFVIDRKTSDKWGGTGQSFDWSKIPVYMEEARFQNVTCLIAGGINPANIKELLTYEPAGIDLASGIEREGKKSTFLVREIEKGCGKV